MRTPMPYFELMVNLLCSFLSIRLGINRFRPLMTNFYITKQCNLRCRYCYPPGDEMNVDKDLALELLKKIRPHNPAINFTGGEPTMHPDLPVFLNMAQQLNFNPIIVSTNALSLDNIEPHLDAVDHVIVSLDSMTEKSNDLLSGVPGATSKVVKNLERLSSLADSKRFNLSIHTVVCPENLECLEELATFCERINATLNLSPEHVGDRPNRDLIQSAKYREAIAQMRSLKQQGKPIGASDRYLSAIESFSPHECFPFLSPRVEPDGRVFFPCYVIRKRAFLLQDYSSLFRLMQKEAEWMHNKKSCSNKCYLACYLEVAGFVRNPIRLIKEIPFRRQAIKRSRTSKPEPTKLTVE